MAKSMTLMNYKFFSFFDRVGVNCVEVKGFAAVNPQPLLDNDSCRPTGTTFSRHFKKIN